MRPREPERPPDDDLPTWIRELRERVRDLTDRLFLSEGENARLRNQLARRDAEIARLISHTVVSLGLLAAYVVVTLHGDDGTLLLTALIAYIGGATVEKVTASRSNG